MRVHVCVAIETSFYTEIYHLYTVLGGKSTALSVYFDLPCAAMPLGEITAANLGVSLWFLIENGGFTLEVWRFLLVSPS